MNTVNFYSSTDGSPVRVDNLPSALFARAEALVEAGYWTVIARDVPEALADHFWEQLTTHDRQTQSFAV